MAGVPPVVAGLAYALGVPATSPPAGPGGQAA
jgi:hypothetical protein